jgi:DNA-binding NarL/FixJ family response regulator
MMTPDRDISILLADDHTLMRQTLKDALNREPGIRVTADTDNGRKAVELAENYAPDIIILDINMPGINGIETAKRLIKDNPKTKILALSMHCEPYYIHGMIHAGSSGFLIKTCPFSELLTAVKTIVGGDRYLCLETRKALAASPSEKQDADPSIARLTDRETEILKHIAEGLTSLEISKTLYISKRTVDIHRANIMRKLNINTIAGLTLFAVREKVIAV